MIKAQHKTTIKLGNNFLTPKVIGRNSLSKFDCVGELVANCLDWRITKLNRTETTRIKIKIADNSIQIIDNGVGMDHAELDTAIDLAESGNDIRARLDDEERKGMYGLGMKVAVLSLGWKFTINTVSIKDPQTELKFEFDSRKLEDKKSDYLQRLAITEETRIGGSPLAGFPSGTSITIEDLVEGKEINSAATLGADLQERFSPDINNLIDQGRLDFTIEGEDGYTYTIKKVNISAKFQDAVLKLDFENPSHWAKKRVYNYIGSDGNRYQLKGFIQLLKERSVVEQNFGLNLYCKGQLIERFHKEKDGLFSIAGRSAEKTYGELHLDGCFPDNVKAHGFIRDPAFLSIRELIKEDLEVYKYLSPTTKSAEPRVRDEVNKRKGLGSAAIPKPEPKAEKPSLDEVISQKQAPSPEMPPGTITIAQNLYIQVRDTWIHETALDKKRNVSWEPLFEQSKTDNNLYRLQLYINPNSNLYKAILDLYTNKAEQNKIMSFFKKMAVCECINQRLISEHNYTSEDSRDIIDEKVYPQVLKMKID